VLDCPAHIVPGAAVNPLITGNGLTTNVIGFNDVSLHRFKVAINVYTPDVLAKYGFVVPLDAPFNNHLYVYPALFGALNVMLAPVQMDMVLGPNGVNSATGLGLIWYGLPVDDLLQVLPDTVKVTLPPLMAPIAGLYCATYTVSVAPAIGVPFTIH
jgi:hypothetical protein